MIERNIPEELNKSKGISVAGKFILKCMFLSRKKDNRLLEFLNLENFKSLLITEKSGLNLPMVKLSFTCLSDSVLKFLNQGNILRIYVSSIKQETGSNVNTKSSFFIYHDFSILDSVIVPGYSTKDIEVVGISNCTELLYNRYNKIYKNKTSKEVFKEISEKYFTFNFSDEKQEKFELNMPDDRQNWIQCGNEFDFLNQVYAHSNYTDSFPIIGITSNGLFKLRDFKSHLNREIPYKYKVCSNNDVNSISDIPEIIHMGDVINRTNAMVLNSWRSSNTLLPVYDMDNGPFPIVFQSKVKLGMLTKKNYSNIAYDIKPTYLPPVLDSDNTFPDFYLSKLKNLSSVAVYSSEKITFSINSVDDGLEVLDIIMLLEKTNLKKDNVSEYIENTDDEGSGGGNSGEENIDDISGLYLVTKITRTYALGHAVTYVEACREFHPGKIGSFVEE